MIYRISFLVFILWGLTTCHNGNNSSNNNNGNSEKDNQRDSSESTSAANLYAYFNNHNAFVNADPSIGICYDGPFVQYSFTDIVGLDFNHTDFYSSAPPIHRYHNILETFCLKGKVNQIIGSRFYGVDDFFQLIFDEKGNLIEENEQNPVHSDWTFRYDDKDKLLEVNSTYKYSYDDNMKLTEESSSEGKISYIKYNDKLNEIEENKYDNHGNLVESTLLNYDNRGNLIEIYNGKIEDKSFEKAWSFKYDNNGNIIEENGIPFMSRNLRQNIYKYDSRGNMIEKKSTIFNSDKNITKEEKYTYSYSYSDDGNVIEQTQYYDQGSISPDKIVHKYEYDKFRNWVKRVNSKNGIETSTDTRDITYFSNTPVVVKDSSAVRDSFAIKDTSITKDTSNSSLK